MNLKYIFVTCYQRFKPSVGMWVWDRLGKLESIESIGLFMDLVVSNKNVENLQSYPLKMITSIKEWLLACYHDY